MLEQFVGVIRGEVAVWSLTFETDEALIVANIFERLVEGQFHSIGVIADAN